MKMSHHQRNLHAIVVFFMLSFTVASSSSASSTFDPQQFCTLVVSGTKIKDPRACNTWIECVNQEPVSGTCSDGLFYDRESEECVPSDSINCISSDPCAATAGTNGFVADPFSCNGYYYCNNGVSAHGECSTGMNYNPGTQDCIRNFPCTTQMSPDSYCNIVPDGVFIKNTTNCNGYAMCWKGTVLYGECPGTFYFNALKGDCDYPQNVDCVDETTQAPIIAEPGECSKAGVFISDGTTCNGYYYCQASETVSGEFILLHGECSGGSFFDATNDGECVNRTLISCEYNRCAGLGANGIQLANESDDDCKNYIICQDGVQIGVGSCPNDEYFDEVTQRCTTEVIDYPACALTTTTTTATAAKVTMMNDSGIDGNDDGDGTKTTTADDNITATTSNA